MSQDPLIGRQLANFRVERLLGYGGMATVYFGRDVTLQRPVAIKVISERFRDDEDYARRFIQEARSVATWRHENIIQVYYADNKDGLYYFVMEYIDGLDLLSLLEQYSADGELMPISDVLTIGKAVASALDYAHAKGVIHRDVKPGNVMIANDGRVVLMDFGLALVVSEHTQGTTFGTPRYISPEQVRGSANAVPQSDLYALGVILYEMLTGTLPFDSDSLMALALQHLNEPPPPPREVNPNLSEAVEEVLLKSLAKNIQDRYQSGGALMMALEEALKAEPAAESPSLAATVTDVSQSQRASMTIAERVQAHVRESETPPLYQGPTPETLPPTMADAPSASAPAAPESSRQRTWFMIIGVVIILAVIVGGVLLLSGGDDEGESSEQAASTTTPTSSPTNTATVTATATASATPTETLVPSPTLTATDNPTIVAALQTATSIAATNVAVLDAFDRTGTAQAERENASATALAQPTATNTPEPPTATPADTDTPMPLEPTVLYPDGRQTRLIYDFNSLYWLNESDVDLPAAMIAFEALDENGEPVNLTLDGSRWTQFFDAVEPGSCMAAEISGATPWLRPDDCARLNATTSPSRTGIFAFWTPNANLELSEFRVLWDDEEIARCPLATEPRNEIECAVFIPAAGETVAAQPTTVAPTATRRLTNTPEPPTATRRPTEPAPPPTEVAAEPTNLPPPNTTEPTEPSADAPDGRQTLLIYDFNSLYWLNQTDEDIPAAPIAFEALDENGEPVDLRLEGTRWTSFFAFVEPGNCMAAEISGARPLLRPDDCRFRNATTNPARTGRFAFWTANTELDLSEFRVLWNDEEIARCPLATEDTGELRCEVLIPPEGSTAAAVELPETDQPAETTAPSPQDGPSGEAAVPYPDGRQMELIYDFNSFYWYNPSGDNVRVLPIIFETLNEDGMPVDLRFEGARWSQFYAFVESGACVAAEITRARPYLRPNDCGWYNATTNPPRTSPLTFWTTRPDRDLSEFRVLWAGEEIGRCPLATEDGGEVRCDIFLPSGDRPPPSNGQGPPPPG